MSTTSVSNKSINTSVFTWSSVASGKKQTQAEIEAGHLKIKQQEDEKKRLIMEKQREQELLVRLASEKREHEFAQQNALRLCQIAEEEKERAERFTRENGHWPIPVKIRYIEEEIAPGAYFRNTRHQPVPKNVNERAMKFIEEMLVNYPEVTTTCKTVGDFRKVFADAYIAHLLWVYDKRAIEQCCFPHSITKDNRGVLYDAFQKWVLEGEVEYKQDCAEFKRRQGLVPTPPWVDKKWVFGKNVNFQSCLWAMNNLSKTFEMETLDEATGKPNTGFARIQGNPKYNYSYDYPTIEWLTNLETYQGLPHERKEECFQKRQEKERVERDEW